MAESEAPKNDQNYFRHHEGGCLLMNMCEMKLKTGTQQDADRLDMKGLWFI